MSVAAPRGRTRTPAALAAGPQLLLHRAAVGPDYGVGPPEFYPQVAPSGLESGRVVQVAANYGLAGGADIDPAHRMVGWADRTMLGGTRTPAPTNPYGPESTPMWNVLGPPTGFGLHVATAQGQAGGAVTRVSNVQLSAVPAQAASASLSGAAGPTSSGMK